MVGRQTHYEREGVSLPPQVEQDNQGEARIVVDKLFWDENIPAKLDPPQRVEGKQKETVLLRGTWWGEERGEGDDTFLEYRVSSHPDFMMATTATYPISLKRAMFEGYLRDQGDGFKMVVFDEDSMRQLGVVFVDLSSLTPSNPVQGFYTVYDRDMNESISEEESRTPLANKANALGRLRLSATVTYTDEEQGQGAGGSPNGGLGRASSQLMGHISMRVARHGEPSHPTQPISHNAPESPQPPHASTMAQEPHPPSVPTGSSGPPHRTASPLPQKPNRHGNDSTQNLCVGLPQIATVPSCTVRITIRRALHVTYVSNQHDFSQAYPPSAYVSFEAFATRARTPWESTSTVAQDLGGDTQMGKLVPLNDPYFSTTGAATMTSSPVWDTSYNFSVNTDLELHSAKFSLWHQPDLPPHMDHQNLSPTSTPEPQLLGTSEVDLTVLRHDMPIEGWYHVHSTYKETARNVVGQLLVGVQVVDGGPIPNTQSLGKSYRTMPPVYGYPKGIPPEPQFDLEREIALELEIQSEQKLEMAKRKQEQEIEKNREREERRNRTLSRDKELSMLGFPGRKENGGDPGTEERSPGNAWGTGSGDALSTAGVGSDDEKKALASNLRELEMINSNLLSSHPNQTTLRPVSPNRPRSPPRQSSLLSSLPRRSLPRPGSPDRGLPGYRSPPRSRAPSNENTATITVRTNSPPGARTQATISANPSSNTSALSSNHSVGQLSNASQHNISLNGLGAGVRLASQFADVSHNLSNSNVTLNTSEGETKIQLQGGGERLSGLRALKGRYEAAGLEQMRSGTTTALVTTSAPPPSTTAALSGGAMSILNRTSLTSSPTKTKVTINLNNESPTNTNNEHREYIAGLRRCLAKIDQ